MKSQNSNNAFTAEEREDIDAQLLSDMRTMRKELKKLSKNELIALVFDQMGRYMEQKQANEALLAKMGEDSEDNS